MGSVVGVLLFLGLLWAGVYLNKRFRERIEKDANMIMSFYSDGRRFTGFQAMKELGLSMGRTYPALDRLERAELLGSEFEQLDSSETRRPRRLYFVNR